MIKTGKIITLSENNLEEVLGRLQNICNTYRMMTKYQVFRNDLKHEDLSHRHSSYGWMKHVEYLGDWKFKKTINYERHDNFYKVEKHGFREEYENGTIKSFELDIYNKFKSYISIFYGGSNNHVLSEGDKIVFTKDGGFITYTTNEHTRFDGDLIIYRETFIPNRIDGKIISLNSEIEELKRKQDEDAEYWNKEFDKKIEREMEIYENYEEDYYNDNELYDYDSF